MADNRQTYKSFGIAVGFPGPDIKQLIGDPASDPINIIKNSYLELRFYNDSQGGYLKRFLPFLGEVTITETRKANYINYNPISRNTQIPFYTGSESRVFKVVYELAPDFLRSSSVSSLPARLLSTGALTGNSKTPANDKDLFFSTARSGPATTGNSQYNYLFRNVGVPPENQDQVIVKFIDYQINLLRSTVINNSVKPTYGPPLVRLNHGILYQNIPCVCLDYSLDQQYADSNKRLYGPVSKLSRYKIQLSFTLQEVRNGNFLLSPFDISDSIAQDNIVGWEQIIEGQGSLDPITPIYK